LNKIHVANDEHVAGARAICLWQPPRRDLKQGGHDADLREAIRCGSETLGFHSLLPQRACLSHTRRIVGMAQMAPARWYRTMALRL
jgi:hypothetical protein